MRVAPGVRQHQSRMQAGALGSRTQPVASTSCSTDIKVSVCTNKACKRQGSPQVLKFIEDLALPGLTASSCACLGACGKGPNLVILSQEHGASEPRYVMLSHVATPMDAADALQAVCGMTIPEADLAALQARLQGNQLAVEGNLDAAIAKYTEGIQLEPRSGLHLLYCNRSAALLQLGRKEQALEDALKGLELSPPVFAKAWIRAVDAHYACGNMEAAASLARKALKQSPDFATLPQFKDIRLALKRAGHDILT